MAAAVLVRLPSVSVPGAGAGVRDAYIGENGLPYITELDSYYHVRLTDNFLNTGSLGDSVNDQGDAWDSRSFYPEGRSAKYQPGIIYLAAAFYRVLHSVFGADLYTAEYILAAFMSALAALAAFIVGLRMAGNIGGLVSGILVGCCPAFVYRTTFGWFDTDMFVIIMDVLLILFLSEGLRSRSVKKAVISSLLFALTVYLYSVTWAVNYAMLFALLTIAGGLIFILLMFFVPGTPADTHGIFGRYIRRPALLAFFLSIALSVAVLVISNGTSFFSGLGNAAVQMTDVTSSGVLPNLFASVSELQVPKMVPGDFLQWFSSYIPGQMMTVVNGTGGAAIFLLAFGALIMMVIRILMRGKKAFACMPRRMDCAVYLCMMGLWFAGGIYATGRGVRFIEHLGVPVGILAGAFAGWLIPVNWKEGLKKQIPMLIFSFVLGVICVIPTVSGAVKTSADNLPSISDVTKEAMDWIRDNSDDPEAPIVSWWDMGYYYEYGSGHPVSWDGGSFNGIRSILIGKILTAEDMQLSRRLIKMLCHSGNRSIDLLSKHLEIKDAYEAVWECVMLEKEEAAGLLEDRYALESSDAQAAGRLIAADKPQEIYLVITGSMMNRLGWFEFYGGWDFTGKAPLPVNTVYSKTHDGRYDMGSDDAGVQEFFRARSMETIWKLYFERDGGECFSLEFDKYDGVERVQIWRVLD